MGRGTLRSALAIKQTIDRIGKDDKNNDKKDRCPNCGRELNEGYNNFIWCICGYKDRSKENPELNKRDNDLLKKVF